MTGPYSHYHLKIWPTFKVSLLKIIYYIRHFVINVLIPAYHLQILYMCMVMISHSKFSLLNFCGT